MKILIYVFFILTIPITVGLLSFYYEPILTAEIGYEINPRTYPSEKEIKDCKDLVYKETNKYAEEKGLDKVNEHTQLKINDLSLREIYDDQWIFNLTVSMYLGQCKGPTSYTLEKVVSERKMTLREIIGYNLNK